MAITVTCDGVDYSAFFRAYDAEGQTFSNFANAARMGESTQGAIVLEDDSGVAINHAKIASQKRVIVTENASGSPVKLLNGWIANKELARGDIPTAEAMRWSIATEDANIFLRGVMVTESARPAETDRARVLAYLAAYLNGTSSTNENARTSVTLATTYVANSNLVNLPARTYRDTTLYDVFHEIAEQSGKDFFVTQDLEFFYDIPTSTAYAAGLSISAQFGAANNTTVFAPFDVEGDHHGQAMLTGGAMRYAGDNLVVLHNLFGAEANHDRWEEIFSDPDITTSAEASALLSAIIQSRHNEQFGYRCAIKLKADQVGLVKVGQTLTINIPAVDVDGPATQRVVRCTYIPAFPGWYHVLLELGWPRNPAPRSNARPSTPLPPGPAQSASCALSPSDMTAISTPNGGFELGNTTQWGGAILQTTGGAEGTGYHSGTNSLDPRWAYHGWADAGLVFTAGTTYVFRFWILGAGAHRIWIGDLDFGGSSPSGDYEELLTNGNTQGSGSWTLQCMEWTPTANRNAVRLFHDKPGHGELTIDQLQAYTGKAASTPNPPGSPAPGSTNVWSPIDHVHPPGIVSTVDPTVNDDSGDGHEVGLVWVNTTTGIAWMLLNDTVGAAVWRPVHSVGEKVYAHVTFR